MNLNQTTLFDTCVRLSFPLRSIFYMVSPSETYYKNLNDVPDLTGKATNVFFFFILLEYVINVAKFDKRHRGSLGDSITSIGSGMFLFLPNWFFRKISYVTYEWCYEKFRLPIELPHDSVWTFFLTILLVDMMYYWFHRAAHEVNFFWAAHQMHHSSEEYNLTTALRKSIFQVYVSWIFYTPLALFIRPSTFIVHSHLNLISQFWQHTEIIETLGPLEYILNTASHHRVHHGRNSYCVDKNYGGVFIIWDRLFGTFEAEKKGEEIAYGLIHPVRTYDPFYLQIFDYKNIYDKCRDASTWKQFFSILFRGPGWTPDQNKVEYPKIEYPIRKFSINLPMFLNVYLIVHSVFVAILYTTFSKRLEVLSFVVLSSFFIYFLFTFKSFGSLVENKANAIKIEIFRCLISISINFIFKTELENLFVSNIFYLAHTALNSLSLIFLVFKTNLFKKMKQSTEKIQ